MERGLLLSSLHDRQDRGRRGKSSGKLCWGQKLVIQQMQRSFAAMSCSCCKVGRRKRFAWKIIYWQYFSLGRERA